MTTSGSMNASGAGVPKRGLKGTCRGVRILVDELYGLACGPLPAVGVDRRRVLAHLRQISMYVCHVALGISQTQVGFAYGRDRTTVAHACRLTEARRDDRAYDDFVAAAERVAGALLAPKGEACDESA